MLNIIEASKAERPFVAAHRGDSTSAPENTLAAFEKAIESGADMIETDIQFTKDKIPALYHNSILEFQGVKKHIYEVTYSELYKYDAGEGFEGDFKGEHIPLLSELFQLAKGKIYLNLEIKATPDINYSEYLDIILNLIYKHGVEDQVMLASFYYDLLAALKQINPTIPIAAIRIPHKPMNPSEITAFLPIDAYICSLSGINKDISTDSAKNNIILGAYSIDNEKHLDKSIRYGIKALGSNNPKLIVDLLRQRGLIN
jgi:glycerophosphoryl diester phosphodiesterase